MKKLILTLGTPGSGKSYWIKKNNLEKYTISIDKLREELIPGYKDIKLDGIVWKTMFQKLSSKMFRNEPLIIIDAAHSMLEYIIDKYIELADKYNYEIIIIDFRSVTLDQCIENISKRDERNNIDENYLTLIYDRCKNQYIYPWIKIIDKDTFENESNDLSI